MSKIRTTPKAHQICKFEFNLFQVFAPHPPCTPSTHCHGYAAESCVIMGGTVSGPSLISRLFSRPWLVRHQELDFSISIWFLLILGRLGVRCGQCERGLLGQSPVTRNSLDNRRWLYMQRESLKRPHHQRCVLQICQGTINMEIKPGTRLHHND